MTTNTIINKTMEQIERNYRMAKSMDSIADRMAFLNQAFGMVQLAVVLVPVEEFDKLNDLWDGYKHKFENLIYGI